MQWTKFAAGAVLAAASVCLFIFGDGGKEMLVAASNLSGAAAIILAGTGAAAVKK